MANQALIIPSAQAAEAAARAALELIVNSPDTQQRAQAMLERVRLAGRSLDADAKALKRPHQEAIKEIDAAAKPFKDLLNQRDGELTQKLIAYQEFCEAEAARRQALELAKFERKVERQEAKAEAAGKPVPIIAPPPVVAPPPRTVETATGAKQIIQERTVWELPIVTINGSAVQLDKDSLTYEDARQYDLKIPDKYFVLDAGLIGKVVRSGGDVPGIVIKTVKGITVRAGG